MTNQEWKAKVLRFINHFFPRPVHPFNLRNESEFTYADWQFEKAHDTLTFYLEQYSIADMFEGKRVLDFGCGEAGKSIYYAGLGAKQVVGVDIVAEYEERAMRFARKHDCSNFQFICSDVFRAGENAAGDHENPAPGRKGVHQFPALLSSFWSPFTG